jgi:hypothetical protein
MKQALLPFLKKAFKDKTEIEGVFLLEDENGRHIFIVAPRHSNEVYALEMQVATEAITKVEGSDNLNFRVLASKGRDPKSIVPPNAVSIFELGVNKANL